MKNWESTLVSPKTTIRRALEIIDSSAAQIVLVTDPGRRLLGTVTDGDVRRAILRGVSLEDEVRNVMHIEPVTADLDTDRGPILELMKTKGIHQVPLIDKAGRVAGLQIIDDLLRNGSHEHWAVLMAGGNGERLRPYTESCPKPLLKVGDRPVLETIILALKASGFRRFFLSVNYKAEMIEEYFGSGEAFGVEIDYLREQKPLGTAGALSLLPQRPPGPFLVMNGDLLTNVDFTRLLQFHKKTPTEATMCVREYCMEVPFGVVSTEDIRLAALEEKPTRKFFVNAGIYVLNPSTLDLIPRNEKYNITELFKSLVENNRSSSVYLIREYWLDIGRMDDYAAAQTDYQRLFA